MLVISILAITAFMAALLLGQVSGEEEKPGPCFVCDGRDPPEPDRMVDVPGMESYSCLEIFLLVPVVLPDESDAECELLRSIDNICGCPVPENACHLCEANEVLAFPKKEVPFYSLGFDGHAPTCEVVEAYLKGSFKADEEGCSFAQNFVSGYCGCYNMDKGPPPVDSAPIGDSCRVCEDGQEFSSSDPVSTVSPFQSCWELEQAALSFLANGSSECTALAGLAEREGCQCTDITVPCDICGGNGTIAFPNKKIPFLEEEFEYVPTCGELFFYDVGARSVDSILCKDFQRLSSYCGCGISDGCGFQCSPDDASISQQYQDKLVGPELAATLTNMRIGTFLDISYTCEYLQTVISSQVEGDQTHAICLQAHEFRRDCGCNVRSKCDMCAGNGKVAMPDRPMPFLESHFGYVPTCADYADYIEQFEVFENVCKASAVFGNYCGCSNIGSCDFQCSDSGGVSDPFLDVDLGSQARKTLVSTFVGRGEDPGIEFAATCAVIESAVKSQDGGSEFCHIARNAGALCGCSEKMTHIEAWFRWYGAKSDKDEHRLLWTSRVAAFLSIVGAMAVVIDIVRDSNKKRFLYNQIMFCMSVFSVIYSVAYAISRVAMPMDGVSLAFENFYGAKGTNLTCSIQGFFVQLGFTAYVYSGALSLYFAVVVAEKWSPERQAYLRPYFLYTPIAIGITLSLAIIPFVEPAGNVCHVIRPYHEDPCWAAIAAFFYVPAFLVMAVSTISVMFIFWKAHQDQDWNSDNDSESSSQDEKAETISATASVGNTIRASVLCCMKLCRRPDALMHGRHKFVREILVTSSLFLMGLYITLFWPLIASMVSDAIESEKYNFWVVTYFVVPLHGFWTALVYFRLRMVRQYRLRLANMSRWWSQRGKIPEVPTDPPQRKSRGETTATSSGCWQATAFPMSSVPEETRLDVVVEMDESVVLP